MHMRLAFAVAIHVEPDILIVDEVLAVGDEAFQRKCYAKLEELKQCGMSLLFVSHSAGSVIAPRAGRSGIVRVSVKACVQLLKSASLLG